MIYEVWQALSNYIMDKSDHRLAALDMIEMLIEHDFSAEEIRAAFDSDSTVLAAVKDYVSMQSDDDEWSDEPLDSDDYDDYDDDDDYDE